MRNLLRFIVNNQFTLLFLVIEFFSIALVVRHNNYQQAWYNNFSQNINGYLSQKKNNLIQYLSLKELNYQLSSENEALRNQIEQINIKNPTKQVIITDTIHKQHYSYIIAKVISNTVNKQYNYLTLDKGTSDGVKPEMAIISDHGVVGIVESATEHFTLVISLLNRNLKVSAKIKKNNCFGSFEWSGVNYRTGYLNEIPLHIPIAIGDTVVTTGFSSIFPEGISLGYITDFSIKGGNFYKIKLLISNEFKSLSYVYIVNNYQKEEQNQLESNLKHD